MNVIPARKINVTYDSLKNTKKVYLAEFYSKLSFCLSALIQKSVNYQMLLTEESHTAHRRH